MTKCEKFIGKGKINKMCSHCSICFQKKRVRTLRASRCRVDKECSHLIGCSLFSHSHNALVFSGYCSPLPLFSLPSLFRVFWSGSFGRHHTVRCASLLAGRYFFATKRDSGREGRGAERVIHFQSHWRPPPLYPLSPVSLHRTCPPLCTTSRDEWRPALIE